jgi:dipeptidyl aminopeptidase/acylaminoacyl peptidase
MRKRLAVLTLVSLLASWALAQQRTNSRAITVPDSIVAEGVPPIPQALAEQASRYTESRNAVLYDWHPRKREILIGTRFAETTQVHAVNFPDGARRQLTFFPDRIAQALYHPHQGDYFVFQKDVGGGEWFQLFRYDMGDGRITLLTDGKSRNEELHWSNAGDRLAYSSTRRNDRDFDFWVMDPANKSSDKMVSQNQGAWAVVDWSPDDKTLLTTESISVNEAYVWLVDVASGKKSLVTEKGERVAWNPIAFSGNAKGIYLTTDKQGEFQRLAFMDLVTKKSTFLTSDSWDVEAAAMAKNRKLLAFVVNENGIGVLHVLDLLTRREKPLPKLPVGLISQLRWHENNRELGFVVNSAKSPADTYSIDIATGKLDRWTYSETGGLNPQNFADPKLIQWKAADGLQLSGFLYPPDPAKFPGRRPVMVLIHGGPEAQYRPGFIGRYNYFVNELGIALVMPNVRGSTGYGKTFTDMDNGLKRETSYEDVKSLLLWIQKQSALDGNRILVTGGSYGGHMTLVAATRYNDLICCSVDVVGMSNLVTFLEHTEAYRRDLRRAEYGDERDPKTREFLERIAPLNHVKEIRKPIFIVQGWNDPRVPKSEADQMVAALKQQNTHVWYVAAKDEGHGFVKKRNADYQFYATILFVREFLLNTSGQ